jgi:hypothetical protein
MRASSFNLHSERAGEATRPIVGSIPTQKRSVQDEPTLLRTYGVQESAEGKKDKKKKIGGGNPTEKKNLFIYK